MGVKMLEPFATEFGKKLGLLSAGVISVTDLFFMGAEEFRKFAEMPGIQMIVTAKIKELNKELWNLYNKRRKATEFGITIWTEKDIERIQKIRDEMRLLNKVFDKQDKQIKKVGKTTTKVTKQIIKDYSTLHRDLTINSDSFDRDNRQRELNASIQRQDFMDQWVRGSDESIRKVFDQHTEFTNSIMTQEAWLSRNIIDTNAFTTEQKEINDKSYYTNLQSNIEEAKEKTTAYYDTLRSIDSDNLQLQLLNLDEQKAKIEEVTGANDAVNRWYYEEKNKLTIASGQLSIGVFNNWKAVMKQGLVESIGTWKGWTSVVIGLTKNAFSIVQSSLGDAFHAMVTDMSSLEDVWKDFTGNILRMFTNMLAQMAVQWAASSIIRTLSSGSLTLAGGVAPSIVSTGTTVAGIGSRLAGLFGGGSAAAAGMPTAMNAAMGSGLSAAASAGASALPVAGVGLVPGLGIAAAAWFAMDYLAGLTPRGRPPTQQEREQEQIRKIIESAMGAVGPSGMHERTIDQTIAELNQLASTGGFSEIGQQQLINTTEGLRESQINITLNIDGNALSNVIIEQLRTNGPLNQAILGVT